MNTSFKQFGYVGVLTHDGKFHADEAMALAILFAAFPDHDGLHIVRSRNYRDEFPRLQSRFSPCFMVDIGGEYAPEENKFDHHQQSFKQLHPDGTPMASAGLIWKEFGRDVIMNIIRKKHAARFMNKLLYRSRRNGVDASETIATTAMDQYLFESNNTAIENVRIGVARDIIRGIDARDNGFGAAVEYTTISDMVSAMNPTWMDEPSSRIDGFTFTRYNTHCVPLSRAINLCLTTLTDFIWSKWCMEISSHNVMADIRSSLENNIPYVVLEQSLPWIRAFRQHWDETESLRLVIMKNSATPPIWIVQTPPGDPNDTHTMRTPTPLSWRGLREAELAEVTGVSDAVFAHKEGFICGARTKEGAIALAEQILEWNDSMQQA